MRMLLMVCVLAAGQALAQEPERPAPQGGGDSRARPARTTTIDFEDDTIEGDLTKPDGEYVEARKRVKHSNLIRIREDFEEKVMQSVGEL
jgi:hypothetical protein